MTINMRRILTILILLSWLGLIGLMIWMISVSMDTSATTPTAPPTQDPLSTLPFAPITFVAIASYGLLVLWFLLRQSRPVLTWMVILLILLALTTSTGLLRNEPNSPLMGYGLVFSSAVISLALAIGLQIQLLLPIREVPTLITPGAMRLEVVSGALYGARPRLSQALREPFYIGRDEQGHDTLHLNLWWDKTVSRSSLVHASVVQIESGWFLQTYEAMWLNGHPIEKGNYELQPGAILHIGESEIHFVGLESIQS